MKKEIGLPHGIRHNHIHNSLRKAGERRLVGLVLVSHPGRVFLIPGSKPVAGLLLGPGHGGGGGGGNKEGVERPEERSCNEKQR